MKRVMSFFLIVAVLLFWMPCVHAEDIGRDLDPMLSPDPAAMVLSDEPSNASVLGPAGDGLSGSDIAGGEKKVEKQKKGKKKKSQKSLEKKSSKKKQQKTSSKNSKKKKKNSR